MKTLSVKMDLSDALEYLAFLEAVIQMVQPNADSPSEAIKLSKITQLQVTINQSIMKQASLSDIEEAIKINRNDH